MPKKHILTTALLAALLIAIRYSADRVSAAIARACALVGMERLGGRLAAQLGQFAEGLAIVSSWRQMSCVGAYTVLVWLLEAAGVAMVSRAAGLPLGASAIFTMMAVLGLGMMIPSAPGYVGTYQFLVVAALAMFGVVPSAALAFSLVLHAWLYVTTTLWGVVGLSLGGFSLYDTRRA